MQTCSKCNANSPDSARLCNHCQADLKEFSNSAVALRRFQENPRVDHIILSIHDDCCPVCLERQGAYPKDKAPALPTLGCSHRDGCRCFYQPVLNDIYP